VGLKKYASVSPSAFGLGGKNRIAVVRARYLLLPPLLLDPNPSVSILRK